MVALPVTLYSRQGCGLCEKARAELLAISQTTPLNIEVVDITADPALEKVMFERIPVIEFAGVTLQAPIDPVALRQAIQQAARQRAEAGSVQEKIVDSQTPTPGDQPPTPTPPTGPRVAGRKRDAVITFDKLWLGFSRHWIAVLTVIAALYAGLPFVAPVAMNAGMTGAGEAIYRLYGPVCHQFAFRSWFLFGDQTVYPRERAGVESVGAFEDYASQEPYFANVDVATLDGYLTVAAKNFLGSERMGWKVALCQRDVAIYAAIAVFGVMYGVLRRAGVRVPYLSFWAYLLLAIVPIGLDGFSQLFSSLVPSFYPIRESTPFLRVLTGSLFGLGNAWLAFPYIEESMEESRTGLERKLSRAGVIELPPDTTPG